VAVGAARREEISACDIAAAGRLARKRARQSLGMSAWIFEDPTQRLETARETEGAVGFVKGARRARGFRRWRGLAPQRADARGVRVGDAPWIVRDRQRK
jgi:hypothetical protein